MNIDDKLQLLRDEMKKEGIDAYIIPSADPHQSEYLPEYWQIRKWISGFSGSTGTAVVTFDEACLWTDSRYFIQAEQQLSTSSFQFHKHLNRRNPSYVDWLADNLSLKSKVAVDSSLFSIGQINKFDKILSSKDIELKFTDDFMGRIWTDRPPLSKESIFEHDVSFAGLSRNSKLEKVREVMKEQNVDHHLMTMLDDIAWTFNLRGRDVQCNPVFLSFALISKNDATLFVDTSKIDNALVSKLTDDNVFLKPYDSLNETLSVIPEEQKVLIHRASISQEVFDALKIKQVAYGKSIARHLKAIKNETEIRHIKESMVSDGIALTHAFYWLENTVKERTVSECEFAEKLIECRSQQPHYYGESFDAIVGYKGNGAIIHYKPEKETCANIQNAGVLLCDSGGQYHNGTTDITRTVCFDETPADIKETYTRVLKGHIGLAKAKFPSGTSGGQIDMLARQSLWDAGLNYGHGTGHGVGFFLNVHEPPQSFTPSVSANSENAQKAGMLTSNEPGYYKENEYGIRIENLVLTVHGKKEGFLEFETVTLFPISTQMADITLLTDAEKQWLNNYHKEVFEKLSPSLDEDHKSWLKEKCQAI